MKQFSLDEMKGGWFVGDFSPSVLRSPHVEVAVKTYKQGSFEDAHEHRIATELTLVVSGRVCINSQSFGPGDIVLIEPREVCEFAALDDAVTVVVKMPSAPNDKFSRGS